MSLIRKLWLFTVILLLTFLVLSGCKQAENEKTEKKQESKSESKSDYKNPDLLVSSDWLKENINDPDLKIIDLRNNLKYRLGHIEGAVNLNIESTIDKRKKVKGIVATEEKIEEILGDMGISNDSKVIIYDQELTAIAGRVFWILEYYGHDKVSVLDGGLAKWKKDGNELTRKTPKIEEATFNAKPDPSRIATSEQVKEWLGDEDKVFVDTRPLSEYSEGHLKGSIQKDWIELLTDDDPPLMKKASELESTLKDFGITKDKDIVLY